MNRGKYARRLRLARPAEIRAEVEQRRHKRERDETQGEVVIFLRRVDIDDERAGKPGEHYCVRLVAQVAPLEIHAEHRQNESERAPRDAHPRPVAFVIGHDEHQDGGCRRVNLRDFPLVTRERRSCPSRTEIEERNHQRERHEPQRHPGAQVRRGGESIHANRVHETSQRQGVRLVRQVLQVQLASQQRHNQRGCRPRHRCPRVRERQPQAHEHHQAREIREPAEAGLFESSFDQAFPSPRDPMCVYVEQQSRESESHRERVLGSLEQVVDAEASFENRLRILQEHVARGEQRGQQAEPAKERLAREHASEKQCLRLRQPDDRHVHAGIFERNRSDEKNGADRREDHDCGSPPTRHRQLAERQFHRAEREQHVKSQFRPHRLILEKNQQRARVQQRRQSRDVFLRVPLDAPRKVRPSVNRPIEA